MTIPALDPLTRDPSIPPETRRADCCVLGAGGLLLALLLARKGVRVHLVHVEPDLPGDAIHPGALEILDSIGLADRLLAISHGRMTRLALRAGPRAVTIADFSVLESKFPYVALIPELQLLEFLAAEALKHAGFTSSMGENQSTLIREQGRVVGLRSPGLEVRAKLTIVFNGSLSGLSDLEGLSPIGASPRVEVLWFQLPHLPGDLTQDQAGIRVGPGRILVQIDRGDQWLLGLVLPRGESARLREQGLPAFRAAAAALAPELSERLTTLADWRSITPLEAGSTRLETWHRPGILFLGEAAHPMSPVGGFQLNSAIQDVVEAANLLADPLRTGSVATAHLVEIQRRREFPTRVIQFLQASIQERILSQPSGVDRPLRLPWQFRLPGVTGLATRLIAYGFRRARIE